MIYPKGTLMKCIKESKETDRIIHYVKLGEIMKLNEDAYKEDGNYSFEYTDETGGHQHCYLNQFEKVEQDEIN